MKFETELRKNFGLIVLIILTIVSLLISILFDARTNYLDDYSVFFNLLFSSLFRLIFLIFCIISLGDLVLVRTRNNKITKATSIKIYIVLFILVSYLIKLTVPVCFDLIQGPRYTNGRIVSKDYKLTSKSGRIPYFYLDSESHDFYPEGDSKSNGFETVKEGDFVRVLYGKNTYKAFLIQSSQKR